ncbi:MAG: PocR ligand-binding domain-containing protein [Verrucomicrobia bacterium]|nr:PocR ligand-binding domain-containing protein [Verrucomicrobiota bacterium]
MNTHEDSNHIISTLAHSQVYQDYERAFNEMTGLPINLRPIESWQLPHHGRRNENSFCAMMAERSRTCAACLQTQQQLNNAAKCAPATVTCQFGLCDSAVPVRTGEKTIGYLQTGQVFRRKPSQAQFEKAAKLAKDGGVTASRQEMHEAYFNTTVLPAKRHEAAINLLHIFADHLGMVSNQIMVRNANAEPPMITRAKQFIEEHHTEDLSLSIVSRAVNTSTFYFCKMFKKGTGINFTDYLSRIRIEKAKNLLLNPNLRISEIAYEVGFQSLTHFNRIFKKLAGQSPTHYRGHLPTA